MSKGQIIVLTTDGFWEAQNADGEMYGFERLVSSVNATSSETANGMIEDILQNVRNFVGAAEIHDDLTIVVVMITAASRG